MVDDTQTRNKPENVTTYTPSLLQSIPRRDQRQTLGITEDALPFKGLMKLEIVAMQSDAVTAVSRYLASRTASELEVESPIDVVPNFVDLRAFARRPPRQDCAKAMRPKDEKLLMHVSNFRPVKRLRDVVEVFARVRQALPARLLLVGDGPERPATEAAARELGVAEDVMFLGKQTDLPPLLSCGTTSSALVRPGAAAAAPWPISAEHDGRCQSSASTVALSSPAAG